MEFPVVAVDKKGQGVLLLSAERAIIVGPDGLIEFSGPPPVLKMTSFPVKLFANHLAAGTVHHPYEVGVIKVLQEHYESFLMPRYLSVDEVKKHLNTSARPDAAEKFFPFWAPPTTEEDTEDMATKKPAAKKAATKKAAPAAKPVKAKAAPAAEKPAGRKPGVTVFICEQLLKGTAPEKIIAAIADKFPASKAGKNEISWCRNKLKKEGKL